MITKKSSRRISRFQIRSMMAVAVAGVAALVPHALGGDVYLQSTGTNLNAGSSWQGGSAPTTLDVAVFQYSLTTPMFFSGNASWEGIRLESLNNPVSINPGYTLTLGDLGIQAGSYDYTMTVNNTLMIGVNQTWSVYGAGLKIAGPVINPAANMLVVNEYGPTLFSGGITGGSGLAAGTVQVNMYNSATFSGGDIIGSFIATGGNSANTLTLAGAHVGHIGLVWQLSDRDLAGGDGRRGVPHGWRHR